jgi:hypothetical protein
LRVKGNFLQDAQQLGALVLFEHKVRLPAVAATLLPQHLTVSVQGILWWVVVAVQRSFLQNAQQLGGRCCWNIRLAWRMVAGAGGVGWLAAQLPAGCTAAGAHCVLFDHKVDT